MMFKGNFLLWIVVELLWFGLQLSFIGVLYLHTDAIGTWTKWQVVLLVGASHFIQQIFQAFFLINCTNLSELVRTGKLDFLLLLPVNTRFVVSLRQVDLGGFVNAVRRRRDGLRRAATPSRAHLRARPGLLRAVRRRHFDSLLADVHAGDHQLLDRARAGHRVGLLQPVQHRAHAGRRRSRGLFKAVFTFALPMLLVSNVPVRLLVDTLTSPKLFLLLGMAVVCFADFRMGLAHLHAPLHQRQFDF